MRNSAVGFIYETLFPTSWSNSEDWKHSVAVATTQLCLCSLKKKKKKKIGLFCQFVPTYDSLSRLTYPCSRHLHRTSSSCGRIPRCRTGTRPRGSAASWAPFCGCSAPWTRPTCPCSPGRRRSSTAWECTLSRCSGTRAGRRSEPSISLHRCRRRSRRRRHKQRWAPHTSRYGTGNRWRGMLCHL